jgi:predicted secreted protein
MALASIETNQDAFAFTVPSEEMQRKPTVAAVEIPTHARTLQTRPDDHCLLAWFSCLFCCWPMGLVAICKACQVRERYENRDIDGAYIASASAKAWAVRAIVVGTCLVVLGIIVHVATANNANSNE